jgi:Domain of unknown function (DUF4124)
MKKIFILLFILLTNNSYSETYKCTNANGKITYTDAPCKNSSQTSIVLSPINTITTNTPHSSVETIATPATALPLGTHYALTIEEAYAAIPHKRTVFEPKQSLLPSTRITILRQLFDIADEAIVLKIIAGKAMQANDTQRVKKTISDYDALINHLSNLNVSSEIKPVHANLLTAIQKHQHHFQTKQTQFETTNRYDQGFTPDIHEASRTLQQAYGLLIQTFPQESNNNKAAFYDYLCALDFL